MFESDQCLGAREVFLGGGELGLVLGSLGLGLIERSLEQAGVDLGQDVALLDVLAFGEQHFLQLAVDLRMNCHGERGLYAAEPGEVDRHILPSDRGDAHRHARSYGSARRVRRARLLHGVPVDGPAGRQNCKKGCNQNDTAAARRCSVPLCTHSFPLINIAQNYRCKSIARQITNP